MVTSDKGRRGGTGTRCYKATSSAHFVGMVACQRVRGQKCCPFILAVLSKVPAELTDAQPYRWLGFTHQ